MPRILPVIPALVWLLAGCRAQPPAAEGPAPTPPPAEAMSTAMPSDAEAVLAKTDLAAPTQRTPEATSLLDRPLYAQPLAPETLARRGHDLAVARAAFRQDPLDKQNIIWLGRRLSYLGRYRRAFAVYSDGLVLYPDSYRLLRHRGHRAITIRRLDDAIDDLTRAAALIENVADAVEPDGLPNARNLPTSTSHTNIYYHLGLAHYLKGEFEPALDAYRRCLTFAANDDMRCATLYWLYLTLRRLGQDDEAAQILEPVHADMDIIENFAYHRLLLLYKGELTAQQAVGAESDPSPVGVAVDDATLAYGIGAWHLVNGRTDEASATFRAIVAGTAWPAFGYIAAEAELAR